MQMKISMLGVDIGKNVSGVRAFETNWADC